MGRTGVALRCGRGRAGRGEFGSVERAHRPTRGRVATTQSAFPGHPRASAEELTVLWQECVFSFASSSPLDLYRSSEETSNRDTLMKPDVLGGQEPYCSVRVRHGR